MTSPEDDRSSAANTKNHLISTGYELIAHKGFTSVGLKEILDNAGVPKGSFYHYFASKEAFGEAIINAYFTYYQSRLELLEAKPVSAQQKLYDYFQNWYDTQQFDGHDKKCLVVKLSAEVADISDPMRLALDAGYQQTIHWLSQQIRAGWIDGSVPRTPNLAAEGLAKRWYFAWLGASLVTKVSQTNTPLAEVWQMTITELGR